MKSIYWVKKNAKLLALATMAIISFTARHADATECMEGAGSFLCGMSCAPTGDEGPDYAEVVVCGRDEDEAKVFAQPALLLEHGCAANSYTGNGVSTPMTLECAGCSGEWCHNQGGLLDGLNDDWCVNPTAWWQDVICRLGEIASGDLFEAFGLNDPNDPNNVRWLCFGTTLLGTPLPVVEVFAPYHDGIWEEEYHAKQQAIEVWQYLGWSPGQIRLSGIECTDEITNP